MKKILFSIILLSSIQAIFSQVRYLDDVFTRSQIQFTSNVVFGSNYYFLPTPPAPSSTSAGNPQVADLWMDVYTPPASDTVSARPLVILIHTGSFLPKYSNGSPTGSKVDSSIVEIANRFAQKGYVVSAPAYRMGWNPFASTLVERTSQILNAVYRAINDVKTCVKFFRKDRATTNTYKIDTKRIILIGQGSGGYISLAYQFLDKTAETQLPKFLDGLGQSVINPSLVGDVWGNGGTYNVENHNGYATDVAMVANYGGSLGDISWMDQLYPAVPVAGLHCRKDIYAPYDSGNVIVPTTGENVVFVHGTRTVVKKAVSQGINDVWLDHTFTDPISARAYALNPKITSEGLFQIERPDIPSSTLQETSPWEWWDSTAITNEATAQGNPFAPVLHVNALNTNPDMSKTKAMAYIDTIVGFLAPRMYLVLTDPLLASNPEMDLNFSMYPNPSSDYVQVSVDDKNTIRKLMVYDMKGGLVLNIQDINSYTYQFNITYAPKGTYAVTVFTDQGKKTQKLIIR